MTMSNLSVHQQLGEGSTSGKLTEFHNVGTRNKESLRIGREEKREASSGRVLLGLDLAGAESLVVSLGHRIDDGEKEPDDHHADHSGQHHLQPCRFLKQLLQ